MINEKSLLRGYLMAWRWLLFFIGVCVMGICAGVGGFVLNVVMSYYPLWMSLPLAFIIGVCTTIAAIDPKELRL